MDKTDELSPHELIDILSMFMPAIAEHLDFKPKGGSE